MKKTTRGDALVIMLKAPRPGSVKTRLVPPLSHEEAAGLYGCFLQDIFGSVLRLKGVSVYAACAPEGRENLMGLVPKGVEAFPQVGRGLGKRVLNAFKKLFAEGFEKITVIGSDSPDLPPDYIKEAFALLNRRTRLVLGPAEDGGYYLIAMNETNSALFSGIRWSTKDVLRDTIKKARHNAIRFKLLETWHDIDTAEDLKYLRKSRSAPLSSRFLKTLKL